MAEDRAFGRIAVIHNAPRREDGYFINRYEFRNGEYRLMPVTGYRYGTKAEAILDYDLAGHAEPLYDNTDVGYPDLYFFSRLSKMKRLR